MAWGWLARAYAIEEFAYMKATEADNGDEVDESFDTVVGDVEIILEMAEDTFISARETPTEYRTIRQCRKWLKDFRKEKK